VAVLRTATHLLGFTAITDQMSHKKGRRAQPRNGFYIFSCGGFERKLLYVLSKICIAIAIAIGTKINLG
jgi:hypothetical protein